MDRTDNNKDNRRSFDYGGKSAAFAQDDNSEILIKLFDDGVVAVGEEALAHGLGLFFVSERTDLDVEELVLRLVADGHVVASPLEGVEEGVGVFLMRDGGDLDHKGS